MKASKMAFLLVITLRVMVFGASLPGIQNGAISHSFEDSIDSLNTENSPPSTIVGDFPVIPKGNPWSFSCYCTDPDLNDSIRLTWIWGDGAISVANNQSTGGGFIVFCDHTYYYAGIYNLTVWIDDLTELPDHNVTDWGVVNVVNWQPPRVPVITSYAVDNASPFTGES